MCGIYGTTKKYPADVLQRKVKRFAFRGPDYSGMKSYTGENYNLVLGHNRLAIIDLNARANQPMEYDNGNIVVVLNGEIYNYRQLKAQYFADKVFNTESDTEVLCAMYERFGKDCLRYINGDFAFVIYDKQKKILFGAIDRMGDKPFYYHCGEDGFEFCSQLLPLCIGNKYEIDAYGRQCYFTMQYIPSPHTIIEQINKLNPAECFTYDLTKKELHIEEYWDLYANTCGFLSPHGYEEAVTQADELIDSAVQMRMHADRPLGLFLSGGIDSSVVAMYAQRYNPKIEAFSVGFEEARFDESEYAKEVANRLGIKFNHLICRAEQALSVIDGLQYYYDEPMGDASMIPTSLLCEQTGKYVKVALGGDGGDEMFFGYPRYLRYAGYGRMFAFPRWMREIGAVGADMLHKSRVAKSLRMKDVQSLYMNRRPSNAAEKFDALQVQQSLEQCKYLYADRDLRRCFNDFDIKTLMCHAYNVKVDRASMRAGLELRTPMLDYRIVEFTRQLPLEYCYNEDMGQKRILRDLLYRQVPRELFERKKQGFGVPIGQWMQNGVLKDYLVDMLNESTVGLLPDYHGAELLRIRDRHIAGKENQTTLMWLCVNYIAWYRLFKSVGVD